MIPQVELGRAFTPGGTEMKLLRRGDEYLILADGRPLMSSRMHGSEDALARHGCERAENLERPKVLVGGLGMGFTLRAALDRLPPNAEVTVAELLPEIVAWNREYFAALAGAPLEDPRVRVVLGDVRVLLRQGPFDVVLLDVDNGPAAFSDAGNGALYGDAGLRAAWGALAPGGVFAVWSAWSEGRFRDRLLRHGFEVAEHHERGRSKRGPRHTIWVAARR